MRISAFNRSCERKQSHIYPSKSLKKVAISFDHDPILFSTANPADEVFGRHTDFIRTAIRNQLSSHGEEVRKSIVRHTLELGLRHYTRADLEAVRASGETLHIKVLGLTSIAPDVSPGLALATIESIT